MSVARAQPRLIIPAALTALLAGTLAQGADVIDERSLVRGFDVAQFLRADAGFSEGEIQRVVRGEVVSRGLDADDETVALAAAAVIRVTPSFFLDQVRRIEEFKKSAEVLQVARLGVPPSAADFARLTLDEGDLEAVRRCRPGDCDMKLDDRGIDRMHSLPDTADVMTHLRAHLAEYAAAYLQQGNAALMTYHDHGKPSTLFGELQRILKASPYIAREWPDLYGAVANFSGKLPGGVQDFAYWSKEKVGPRTSMTVTHVIIRPPVDGIALIASKQIYASHYSTASLGLTVLVDQGTAADPKTLLVYINRTRVDMFGGLLGSVKRTVVRSRAKSGAERMMTALRTRLEHGVHGKD